MLIFYSFQSNLLSYFKEKEPIPTQGVMFIYFWPGSLILGFTKGTEGFLEKQYMAFLSLKFFLCPIYNAALDNEFILIP